MWGRLMNQFDKGEASLAELGKDCNFPALTVARHATIMCKKTSRAKWHTSRKYLIRTCLEAH